MDSRDYLKAGYDCGLPKSVAAVCYKQAISPECLRQVTYREVAPDVYSVCGWTFYATDEALRERAEVEARRILQKQVPPALLPYFLLSHAAHDYLETHTHADLVAQGRRTMYLYLECGIGGWMVKNEE